MSFSNSSQMAFRRCVDFHQIDLNGKLTNVDNGLDMPLNVFSDGELVSIMGVVTGKLNLSIWNPILHGFEIGELARHYAPDRRLIFLCENSGNARVDILSSGKIMLINQDGDVRTITDINLTGITYNMHSGTLITLINNWMPYEVSFRYPSFKKRGNVVYLEGVIQGGMNNSAFGILPDEYRPASRQVFCVATSSNATARIDITSNGWCFIYANDDNSNSKEYYSLNGICFASDDCKYLDHKMDTNCHFGNLTLNKFWQNYNGGFGVAKYNIYNQMVFLSGVIHNISTETKPQKFFHKKLLLKLPKEITPLRRLIFYSDDFRYGKNKIRLDILPSGEIFYFGSPHDNKISLSNIKFYSGNMIDVISQSNASLLGQKGGKGLRKALKSKEKSYKFIVNGKKLTFWLVKKKPNDTKVEIIIDGKSVYNVSSNSTMEVDHVNLDVSQFVGATGEIILTGQNKQYTSIQNIRTQ